MGYRGYLAEDGDPLDALIPAFGPDLPRLPRDGSATRGFWMEDEKGPRRQDHRGRGWRPDYEDVGRIDDLPRHLLDEIEHFFEIYKDLEPGKSSSTAGFEELQAARKEIAEAQSRAG
jgi:inorganic pyrophosphatase